MQNLKSLQDRLGYKFKEISNLKNALTHKSCKKGKNNERLEFLGDAVMDLVIADYLFRKFKNTDEGDMSKLRAALVNEKSFANLANYLNLGEHIFISTAEENNGGRKKASILSDAFEAVMGAIYIESGFETVNDIAVRLFEICYPDIDLKNLMKDYKTTLQEITQARVGVTPEYKLVRSFGPDHKKEFEIALLLKDVEISRAIGKSKKEAQQLAAKMAIEKIKENS
ncbi:ribonuclease III [Campylobacter sp.]|uniref:ribonuclease III n=1 Tax=Campylobacter sp. TaxID=205 RepID=UPI0027089895|nr:ribonuclease III [Campylobacter sp.]